MTTFYVNTWKDTSSLEEVTYTASVSTEAVDNSAVTCCAEFSSEKEADKLASLIEEGKVTPDNTNCWVSDAGIHTIINGKNTEFYRTLKACGYKDADE